MTPAKCRSRRLAFPLSFACAPITCASKQGQAPPPAPPASSPPAPPPGLCRTSSACSALGLYPTGLLSGRMLKKCIRLDQIYPTAQDPPLCVLKFVHMVQSRHGTGVSCAQMNGICVHGRSKQELQGGRCPPDFGRVVEWEWGRACIDDPLPSSRMQKSLLRAGGGALNDDIWTGLRRATPATSACSPQQQPTGPRGVAEVDRSVSIRPVSA